MSHDLMIVDDYESMLEYMVLLTEFIARENNFPEPRIITFTSGVKALSYLREHVDDLPRGYIVDMRIPGSKEELASPLEIYRLLKQQNAIGDFTFYTGAISEHDRAVQRETGARMLVKCLDHNLIKELIREIIKPQ